MSVTKKTIDIGGQISNWSYTYEQDMTDINESDRNQVNTTVIIGPEARVDYEHFWPELSKNNPNGDGNLAQMRTYDLKSKALLETRTVAWERENGLGFSFSDRHFGGRDPHSRRANMMSSVVTRHYNSGQDSFTTDYSYNSNHGAQNYSFGLPVEVRTFSTLSSSSRVYKYEYENDTSTWLVGLEKKFTSNNKEIRNNIYNATDQLKQQDRFGDFHGSYTCPRL